MSSPSERKVTYVIAGEGEDLAIRDLLAAGGLKPELLCLTGASGDGRRLLEAIASSDQVVYSPWPARNGDEEHGQAGTAHQSSAAPR